MSPTSTASRRVRGTHALRYRGACRARIMHAGVRRPAERARVPRRQGDARSLFCSLRSTLRAAKDVDDPGRAFESLNCEYFLSVVVGLPYVVGLPRRTTALIISLFLYVMHQSAHLRLASPAVCASGLRQRSARPRVMPCSSGGRGRNCGGRYFRHSGFGACARNQARRTRPAAGSVFDILHFDRRDVQPTRHNAPHKRAG